MMRFMPFLLLIVACAASKKSPDRYAMINKLWHERATKEQVIKELGPTFEEKHSGIIYWFTWKSIESGHFFDASGRLKIQFLFVPKERFDELKKTISCSWNEKSEMKSIGHTVHSIESGKCSSENISYSYRPSMLLYEFRWESN